MVWPWLTSCQARLSLSRSELLATSADRTPQVPHPEDSLAPNGTCGSDVMSEPFPPHLLLAPPPLLLAPPPLSLFWWLCVKLLYHL